jgi:hypothetical protein
MKRRNESVEGGKAEKRHVTRVPVFFFFLFFWGRDFAGLGIGGCGECGQLHDIRPRCERFIFLMVMVQLFEVCDDAFAGLEESSHMDGSFVILDAQGRTSHRARRRGDRLSAEQNSAVPQWFGGTPVVRPRWNLSHKSAVLARFDPR